MQNPHPNSTPCLHVTHVALHVAVVEARHAWGFGLLLLLLALSQSRAAAGSFLGLVFGFIVVRLR